MPVAGHCHPKRPAAFFNPVAVELLGKLGFRGPHDWRRWIAQWEHYHIISGLNLPDKSALVNTFIYAMDTEAEDVLFALNLTTNTAKQSRVSLRYILYLVGTSSTGGQV